MVLMTTLGGSTNAVLHLIAMARSVGVELTIDDFQRVSDRCRCWPISSRAARTSWRICTGLAALRRVMKMLLERELLHGDCVTVTGKTLGENLQDLPGLPQGRRSCASFETL